MYHNVAGSLYKTRKLFEGSGFTITEVNYVDPFYRIVNINSEVNSLIHFWEHAHHLQQLYRYNKDELISLLYYLKNNGIDLGLEIEMWLAKENK